MEPQNLYYQLYRSASFLRLVAGMPIYCPALAIRVDETLITFIGLQVGVSDEGYSTSRGRPCVWEAGNRRGGGAVPGQAGSERTSHEVAEDLGLLVNC